MTATQKDFGPVASVSAPATPLHLIHAVRALLATPETWIKGWSAKNAEGKDVLISSDEATKFTFTGAAIRLGGDYNKPPTSIVLNAATVEAIARGCKSIFEYNDCRSTNQEQILDFCDAVMNRLTETRKPTRPPWLSWIARHIKQAAAGESL